MKYQEVAPAKKYRELLERFWQFQLEQNDPDCVHHVIVPDGACTLSLVEFEDGRAPYVSLTGPAEVAIKMNVFAGVRYRGVRIKPGAVKALLAIDVAVLKGKIVPLSILNPALDHDIRNRLLNMNDLSDFARTLESAWQDCAHYNAQLDPIVMDLVTQMMIEQQPLSLSELTQHYSISERQLRRRFIAEVGLTPKVFSRLRRVRWACADLAKHLRSPMTTISADHGFADLPHFNRELQMVFGLSPQLLRQYLTQIQHLEVNELQHRN